MDAISDVAGDGRFGIASVDDAFVSRDWDFTLSSWKQHQYFLISSVSFIRIGGGTWLPILRCASRYS
jgi:hypothetical protein